MGMYTDYLKEKRGMESIETEQGFVTYAVSGECCYIEDVYIKPEYRKSGVAGSFAKQVASIAKGRGCTTLTGSVNFQSIDPTTSVKCMLAYGFEISKVINDAIFFKMEI